MTCLASDGKAEKVTLETDSQCLKAPAVCVSLPQNVKSMFRTQPNQCCHDDCGRREPTDCLLWLQPGGHHLLPFFFFFFNITGLWSSSLARPHLNTLLFLASFAIFSAYSIHRSQSVVFISLRAESHQLCIQALREQLTRRWLTIAAESAGLCDLGLRVCACVAANAAPCVGRCNGWAESCGRSKRKRLWCIIEALHNSISDRWQEARCAGRGPGETPLVHGGV